MEAPTSRSNKRKSTSSGVEGEEKTKKRHRRTAQEIERKFRCDVHNCGKAYGSEGALKMHIRLKHSEDLSNIIVSAGTKQEPVGYNTENTPPPTAVSPVCSTLSSPFSSPSPSVDDVSFESYFESSPSTPTIFIDETFSNEPTVFEEDEKEEAWSPLDFTALKEKFCHIPLLRLNIGLWQAESQCCGDLVAKFAYKERCIVWEIFEVGSLLRTTIPFDDLNGVGLELHPDDTATMVIELRSPPTFQKGELQPQESTVWTPITDFTEGMASTFRRHILHFSRKALNDSIEDIFRRDPRLQSLLLQGLPALRSPYFSSVPTVVPPPFAPVAQPERKSPSPLEAVPASSPRSTSLNDLSLSSCALQNNYSSFLEKHGSERILLPCNHSVIATRDLLRECPCIICGTSYFFSFCAQRVVSTDEMWHCSACNGCKVRKEWHCARCNKCTRSPVAPNANPRAQNVCQSCSRIPAQALPNVANGRGRRSGKKALSPVQQPVTVAHLKYDLPPSIKFEIPSAFLETSFRF